ncbi:MAG: rRNA maturation RNase YbeY [Anaerolineae bacterium]|nr:rRNA maturation RNase YbeY [Anaerolineae bacterium]
MSYLIEVINDLEYAIDESHLVDAASAVLDQHDTDAESGLSIVFVDDAGMQKMNLQFRGIDAPTDVLSFPADAPPVDLPDVPPYLGDLLIAYPYATAQAAREGHALRDSLALLVVHGTLHLLGYDHDTPENKAEMWAAQEDALKSLGISAAIVPPLEGNGDDQFD